MSLKIPKKLKMEVQKVSILIKFKLVFKIILLLTAN